MLTTQVDDFEFLPKANIPKDKIGEHIYEVYENTLLSDYSYEMKYPALEHIPSKWMIMECAFQDFYDGLCFDYTMNGHEGFDWDPHDFLEQGMTREEITYEWMLFRDGNASYFANEAMSKYAFENRYMQDLNRGLNVYHFSYLKDDSTNPYYEPKTVDIHNIVNAPIVKVW